MSLLIDTKNWLEDNPKEEMPYWPGARTTNRVDIRTSQRVLNMGGSPLHPGNDRSRGTGPFTEPFNGRLEWRLLPGTDIGSVFFCRPRGFQMELQGFHTKGPDNVTELEEKMRKGNPMPITPSNLGLSDGVHLHSESLFPYDKELLDWMREGTEYIVRSTNGVLELNIAYITAHCRRWGLDLMMVLDKIPKQVASWGIIEMTNRFMVRNHVGPDRVPHWGAGRTIHVDTKWLLDI